MDRAENETITSFGKKNKYSTIGILLTIGECLGRLRNVDSSLFVEVMEAFGVSEADEEYEEDEEATQ